MTKFKLEDEYDYACLLYGVVSVVPIHTLCWHLNRALRLNLAYTGEQQVIRRGNGTSYSFFSFEDELTYARWHVVANKDGNRLLLPELARYDYIVKVEEYDHVNQSALLNELRGLAPVLACYEFVINEVKSKENLIFE
jgi:hypothetical protein